MLLLDSEALSCIVHGPPGRRDRVRALIAGMRERDLPIATVATVLAEVIRGRPADAATFAALRRERIQVHAVDARVGARAGQILGMARAGPDLTVDAFTVAVADLAGEAIIATVDVSDMRRLAYRASNVTVVDVG